MNFARHAQGSRSRRGSVKTVVGKLPVSLPQSCVRSSQKSGRQGDLAVETHTRCTCSLKTALVPNRKHARWRTIMMGTPFRDSVVVNTWPYLGAALTSSVDNSGVGIHAEEQETANGSSNDLTGGNGGASTNPRNTLVSMGDVVLTQGRNDPISASDNAQWTEAMKALLAYQVWTRSVGRMETRADLTAVANSSVGRRCLLWNAYSDSLIPYPARVVMPDDNTVKRMLTAQRDAIQLGTPRCPLKALSALGVIHGVKRPPRCPKISVQAHSAWAYIRGSPRGPAHARVEQGNLWRCAVFTQTASLLTATHQISSPMTPSIALPESLCRLLMRDSSIPRLNQRMAPEALCTLLFGTSDTLPNIVSGHKKGQLLGDGLLGTVRNGLL